MAVFDRSQQKIVLRIVYDGPARAGKTTNVTQLCEYFTLRRRSELFTPDRMADRTLFFDWMHLDGGLVAGQQLRCQLVTVPGQRSLGARRKQILQTADVVIFVCSSTPRSIERSRGMLETLRWSLRSANRGEIPLIVQANKQDLQSALGVDELRERLGLSNDIQILAASAKDGTGVRETAAVAIRAGATTVEKQLMETGLDGMDGVSESAGELLDQLRALDSGSLNSEATLDELFEDEEGLEAEEQNGKSPASSQASHPESPLAPVARAEPPTEKSAIGVLNTTVSSVASVKDSDQLSTNDITDSSARQSVATREPSSPTTSSSAQLQATSAKSGSTTSSEESREAKSDSQLSKTPELAMQQGANGVAPHGIATTASPNVVEGTGSDNARSTEVDKPAAPKPDDNVGPGCVWPSTTGRQVLRALRRESWQRRWDLTGQRGLNDGSGAPDAMIFQVGGFCAKTSPRRRFASIDDGRDILLQMARSKIRLGDLLPPRTVLALQQESADAGCWVWTVAPWMRTLRADMNDASGTDNMGALTHALEGFAKAVSRAAGIAVRSGVQLDVHPSNFALIDRQVFYLDDDIAYGTTIPGLGHAILQRIEEYAAFPDVIDSYVRFVSTELRSSLSAADMNTLALDQSLRDAIPRHALAVEARDKLISDIERHKSGRGI